MKFPYLSDLHVGKTVNGFSMLNEQHKKAPLSQRGVSPKATGGSISAIDERSNQAPAPAYSPRNATLKPFARELRNNATKQENHLWYDFLNTLKYKFQRQHIIGAYIVGFYCSKARLVIELDGSQHYEPDAIEYDEVRTEYLNTLGLRVIRFSNKEVDKNFYDVCEAIRKELSL